VHIQGKKEESDVCIAVPTVVEPSGRAAATALIAAFSISATIAGVANTFISPEPSVSAVFVSVTMVVLSADNPIFNIFIYSLLILVL
jgi:hypothetical protein